jgi:hypothetical protein
MLHRGLRTLFTTRADTYVYLFIMLAAATIMLMQEFRSELDKF